MKNFILPLENKYHGIHLIGEQHPMLQVEITQAEITKYL